MNPREIARESLARESEREGAKHTAQLYREGKYDEGGIMPAVLRGVELALEQAKTSQKATIETAVEFGYRQCEKGSNLQAALAAARALT